MALFLLKYLWIFILIPKSLQLVAYGAAFGVLLWKRNGQIRLSNSHKCFLMYGLVHILSIIYNCGIRSCEPDRIFAAMNTAMIWILAVLIAAMVSKEKVDVLKAGKYCLYNMLILIGIYFGAKVLGMYSINYGIESRELMTLDWINGMQTYRFTGLMEYSVLVAVFGLVLLPLSVFYLVSKKERLLVFPYLILSFYVISKSNSRMGMLLVAAEAMLSLLYFLWNTKYISKKARIGIYTVVFFCGIAGMFVLYPIVLQVFEKLFFMRGGSNSQRFYIYAESIKATLQNSVILGSGVKDMIGDYPLGSHCTYIGFFYKTGILGTVFAIIGFLLMFRDHIKQFRITKNKKVLYLILSQLLMMAFFVTEDLDGANWLVVLFFLIDAVGYHHLELNHRN